MGWSKPQIKQSFESALVPFLSHRDNRTYAQVLSIKVDNAHIRAANTVRGHCNSPVSALSAPKELVANTDRNTYKVKGSTVDRHKQSLTQQMDCDIQKVNLSALGKPQSDLRHPMAHPSNIQVSQSVCLPTNNRFQILDTIQADQVSDVNTSHADNRDATSVPINGDSYSKRPKTDQSSRNRAIQVDQGSQVIPDITCSLDRDLSLLPAFEKCKAQIGTKFGCIPLAPIYVYRGPVQHWKQIPDVLTAHRLIRNTGIPNFGVFAFQFTPI